MLRHLSCGKHLTNRYYSTVFSPQAISSLILMVGCAVSHPQAGNSRDVHVTQMMDTWTKQMGYPVLTVSKSANNLSQTRFFAVTPEDKNTIPLSPYKWEPLDTAPIILWLRVMVTASPWQISFTRCWYIYLCFSLSLSPVSIAYSMHTQLESGEAQKWGYHLLPTTISVLLCTEFFQVVAASLYVTPSLICTRVYQHCYHSTHSYFCHYKGVLSNRRASG